MTAPPQSISDLWIGVESYDDAAKRWLAHSGHYLDNPPPGCLFCVVVRRVLAGLCGVEIGDGPRLGMCLVGRPIARMLPQNGSVGEIVRMVLVDDMPHGTASAVLRHAADVARARGMSSLIAYHDRTQHTGCIYRKAGFRKDGTTSAKVDAIGWGTRPRPKSGALPQTPKRRWRLNLTTSIARAA